MMLCSMLNRITLPAVIKLIAGEQVQKQEDQLKYYRNYPVKKWCLGQKSDCEVLESDCGYILKIGHFDLLMGWFVM